MQKDNLFKILDAFKDNKLTMKETAVYVETVVVQNIGNEISDKLYKALKKKFLPKIKKAKTLEEFLSIKTELSYCPDSSSTVLIHRALLMTAKDILSEEDYEKL